MQFSISATFFSLALATLGLAAPTANPGVEYLQGWDGKVTAIEEVAVAIGARETAPEPGHLQSKRDLGAFYFCPAFDWQPDGDLKCQKIQFTRSEQCWSLAPQLASSISGIGPDPGTWCMLFTASNCAGGASDAFSYPGMARLDGYWATWNDNTKSIKCWW